MNSKGEPPAGRPCIVSGCTRHSMPVWTEAGRHSRWFPGPAKCPEHLLQEKEAEQLRAVIDRLTRANIPRGKWNYSFDRFLKMRSATPTEPAETFEAFRDRLAAQAVTHLGITPWNASLAQMLRRWNPADRSSVYVTGPVGGGKTTLAAAKVRQLIERDYPGGVFYLTEAELYERQRERAAQLRGSTDESVVAKCRKAGVLVLDDVGVTEEMRPWQRDVFEQIVCARYDADGPLLLTSNLPLADLAEVYGERVGSRLTEMCRRQQNALVGVDWRSMQPHVVTAPAPKPTRVPAEPPPTTRKPRDGRAAAAGERDEEEE